MQTSRVLQSDQYYTSVTVQNSPTHQIYLKYPLLTQEKKKKKTMFAYTPRTSLLRRPF